MPASRRRPYTWRWQAQPPVVTKEPPAVDVIVPAYYRPRVNGPSKGGEVPVDGVWKAGVPHPDGPAFRARPLKIWRKRLLRESKSPGQGAGLGIGMPMDYPGGLGTVTTGTACKDTEICAYSMLPCLGIADGAPEAGGSPAPKFLGSAQAVTLSDAQAACTGNGDCLSLVWSRELQTVRMYGCASGCRLGDPEIADGLIATASANAEAAGVAGPCLGPDTPPLDLEAENAHLGIVQDKTGCRPSAGRCGGAILKDDVKSRSATLPIQKTVPSDSFYDRAAFRMTCLACNPQNNIIRSTVQPVLGPGPGRAVDSRVSQAETLVFKKDMRLTMRGGLDEAVHGVSLSEARSLLRAQVDYLGFSYAHGSLVGSLFPRGRGHPSEGPELLFQPGTNTLILEPPYFAYVEAATSYRSYLFSRCRTTEQRQGRGARIPGRPYFDRDGKPISPSNSELVGPPDYRPVACPHFPADPTTANACTAPYKTSNPRFGVQGAVSSSTRLTRLKYEGATSGSNYTTSGALHARNFGEFSTDPPSGYFLPQNFLVARCNPGLYRRSGDPVACFTPTPRDIDRIER
jgi:hypothetical protein